MLIFFSPQKISMYEMLIQYRSLECLIFWFVPQYDCAIPDFGFYFRTSSAMALMVPLLVLGKKYLKENVDD